MKSLKLMLAAVAMLFVCGNIHAKGITTKLTKEDVVKIYIDAVAHGKVDQLNGVLDDQMQFNLQRGENVNTLDKDQFVSYLQNNQNADQSVTTNTATVQEDDNSMTVKVTFKFADYTRIDTVTLNNQGGWMISTVNSSYK